MKYTHLTPCKCKSIRLCLGWSQKQLAEAAQRSLSTVSKFENYKGIDFNTVLALEEALTETGKVRIHSHGFKFKEETKHGSPSTVSRFENKETKHV